MTHGTLLASECGRVDNVLFFRSELNCVFRFFTFCFVDLPNMMGSHVSLGSPVPPALRGRESGVARHCGHLERHPLIFPPLTHKLFL